MFVAGLLLVLLGALGILGALLGSEGSAELIGVDLSAFGIFVVGLASGVAILWGFALAKLGVKRSMQHRRESKQLQELSEKLDRVDEDKRREVDDDRT